MQRKRESAPHDAVSVKVSRYWQMVWQDVPGQQEIGKVVSRVYVAACVAGFLLLIFTLAICLLGIEFED